MVKILAFDVTLSACSVAVMNGDTVTGLHSPDPDRNQAQMLVPLIQQVMEKAGLEYRELEGIGVTTGPGSFTGVRLGLATARGFGLALGIPVIGISTFDVIAESERRSACAPGSLFRSPVCAFIIVEIEL